MFTHVRVENFQAFKSETEIPLAPITLIFGPNASGKSCFSRALRLLKQNLTSGNGSGYGFVYSGSDINLNGYRSVVHGQIEDNWERDTDFSVGLTFNSTELQREFRGLDRVTVDFTIGNKWTGQGAETNWNGTVDYVTNRTRLWFSPEFAYENAAGVEFCVESTLQLQENRISCNSFSSNEDGSVNSSSQEWSRETMELLQNSSNPEIIDALRIINLGQMSVPIDGVMETWFSNQVQQNWDAKDDDFVDEDTDDFQPDGWDEIFMKSASLNNNFIDVRRLRSPANSDTLVRARFLSSIFQSIRLATKSNLANMSYVGPIREIPQLVEPEGSSRVYGFQKPNEWLKKLTSSRYEVLQQSVGHGSQAHDIWINLVKDNFTGVLNSFQDVGTGISQVYPVIDAAMPTRSSRWANPKTELVVIEQPELHLHPSAQSTLGDMFTECVNDDSRNVQFIIETHSENLLLRIQKNVRDGNLDRDRVSIVYVEPIFDPILKTYEGTSAKKIRLDQAGDIIDPFPQSFADMRIQDLL